MKWLYSGPAIDSIKIIDLPPDVSFDCSADQTSVTFTWDDYPECNFTLLMSLVLQLDIPPTKMEIHLW